MDPASSPAYARRVGLPGAARPGRRLGISAALTIALHAAVLAAIAFGPAPSASRPAPPVALTAVELVAPPPPPPPPPPVVLPPSPAAPLSKTPLPGTLGRRGRDAAVRAPRTASLRGELAVQYDVPTGPDPGHERGTIGDGLGADLSGVGNGALGALAVPPPPRSQARPPRPKLDYSKWEFRADPQFAGAMVQVGLKIDDAGNVRSVELLRGIDAEIDRRALEVARTFQFHPALDDTGRAIAGRHRWEFVIVAATTRGIQFRPAAQ